MRKICVLLACLCTAVPALAQVVTRPFTVVHTAPTGSASASQGPYWVDTTGQVCTPASGSWVCALPSVIAVTAVPSSCVQGLIYQISQGYSGAGQLYSDNGSGGCSQLGSGSGTVSSITSTGSTITVTNGTGPTANVEVNAANAFTWTGYNTWAKGLVTTGGLAGLSSYAANSTIVQSNGGGVSYFDCVGGSGTVGLCAIREISQSAGTVLTWIAGDSAGDATVYGYLSANGLAQPVASTYGGTCAMVSGTSCTITLAHTYTTPVCIVTQQSATLTGGASGCTVSGATATITAAVANSETWGAFVFGNPH